MKKNFNYAQKEQLESLKKKSEQGHNIVTTAGGFNQYPVFNNCDHYLVDMSDMRSEPDGEWMNTISIKLPNDKYVTVCVMQPSDNQSCLDIRYYGEDLKTRAIGFKDGRSQSIEESNLYTVVADVER